MIIKVTHWSFLKTLWVRRRSRNEESLVTTDIKYSVQQNNDA